MAEGFDLLLSKYSNEELQVGYLRYYFQRKVDGLILITPDIENPKIVDIPRKNIPCVIIEGRPAGNTISFVDTNNFGGMYHATEYLIRKGHRSIAFVKGESNSRNACDRFEGFLHAMNKNGITVNENWVYNGNFTPKSDRMP